MSDAASGREDVSRYSQPACVTPGGVAERFIAPVLKTGVALVVTVGSNPSPTVTHILISSRRTPDFKPPSSTCKFPAAMKRGQACAQFFH